MHALRDGTVVPSDGDSQEARATAGAHGGGGEPPHNTFTLFGYPLHLAFVRTYTPPLDVDWASHSFDMHSALLYKDPVIADHFRAFYFRSFLSFTMGTAYLMGFLLIAAFPIITKQYTAVWFVTSAVLVVTVAMDMSLHFFAPVTPTVAKARMVLAFVIGATPMLATAWSMPSTMTECDDAWHLPSFKGRINFSVAEQRRLCVQIFEPSQIVSVTLATLGVILYPIPQAFLAVLHFALCVVARKVTTGSFSHEQPSEIAVDLLMIFVCDVGTMAITFVRFTAGRSAFEATIKVEVQRREASARAAELQQLLHTIVPQAVLPRLEIGGAGQFQIDRMPSASTLFADMRGFTAWSSSRTAEAVTSMLNTVVAALDALSLRMDTVEKVKTVGDAYWAVSGIPVEAENHADQLVLFGWSMNEIVQELNNAHAEWDRVMWRVGIHTGPMTGALFGERQVSYEVFGETAQIAQVVEANGVPGSLVVTEQTVAALHTRPEEQHLRAHSALEGLGPSGGVLTMYELLKPFLEGEERSLPHSFSLTPSAPASSRRSASALSNTTHQRNDPAHVSVTPTGDERRQRSPKALRNIRSFVAESSRPLIDEASFDDAALAALEETKYPVLPYFKNPDTESQFKLQTDSTSRNMTRACVVFLLSAHGVNMSTLVAMPNRCFSPIGTTLQFAALVPYTVAIVFTLLPRMSVKFAMGVLLLAASIGLVGTGLTSLAGCEAGHDLQGYSYIAYATLFSPAGPISWPVLWVVIFSTITLPAMLLAVFFSPVALSSIAYIPLGATMGAAMAFIGESLLRRRFIEGELAKRGETRLALLGEQRVQVLQRLVPKHIVSDLIVWFGTNMDPEKSITRSYRRVVIAFMRLCPEEFGELPKLHAEVDEALIALQDAGDTRISAALQSVPFAPTTPPDSDSAHTVEVVPSRTAGETPPTSILDKIKTVGDVVMIAGPFPTGGSNRSDVEATDDEVLSSFVAVVQLFTKVRSNCIVQVGAHIGPVVGTVQGFSRLAFDIFGDPVNVASRVLTGAPRTESALNVSSALADVAEHCASTGALSTAVPRFGSSNNLTAKGKGELAVQPVLV